MTENANTAEDIFPDDDFDMAAEVEARAESAEQAETEAAEEAEAAVNPAASKPEKIDGIRDPKVYAKGTWQAQIVESARLTDRSVAAKKKASALLWSGATAAITEWESKSDVDVYAENLSADLLDIMGTGRKGDVSKIKSVALAVKNAGLVLSEYENLAKAYAEATRLTKTVKEEKAEDDAAEVAVESIAEQAPASTTTPEGAALILLSKGVDGAIVALLDALNGPSGENNEAAHRAFFRAVGVEVASRAAAAREAAKPAKMQAGPKEGATPAKVTPAKQAVKATPAKTKAAPVKATPAKAKATPVSASKGDPNKKALPVKR